MPLCAQNISTWWTQTVLNTGTTGTIKEPFRCLRDVFIPYTRCRCIHSTFYRLLVYPWQAPMHSWLTSWPLCPVDIILGQRDLHVQIWFLDDGDYLVSYQHPPHGKGLVSLHNISCSRRMLFSHNVKYIYICAYTVVAVRLLCSVFSNTHTKSKVPQLTNREASMAPQTKVSLVLTVCAVRWHSSAFIMSKKPCKTRADTLIKTKQNRVSFKWLKRVVNHANAFHEDDAGMLD